MHFPTFAAFAAAVTAEQGNVVAASAIWTDQQPMTIASEPADVRRAWSVANNNANRVVIRSGSSVTLAAATNTVYSAAGQPAVGVGNNGDISIDYVAGAYYVKSAGAWPASSVAIPAVGGAAATGTTTVINDLTTGGATSALSAAMGVSLKGTADALAGTVSGHTSAIAIKAPLASPTLSNVTLTGTTAAPTVATNDNSTSIATTAYAQALVANAVTGLLHLQGSINASTSPVYPAAVKGDAYLFSAAGFIGGASGKAVNIGDLVVAGLANVGGSEASVGASWFVLEHAIAGALLGTNNLSDLTNITTAWTNLGGDAKAQAAAKLLNLGLFAIGGAIAPASVAATGNVTGLNLSGVNTGDQVIVDNLTTAATSTDATPKTKALSANMGAVLANGNPDPFLGMTSTQIRASAANTAYYFAPYTSATNPATRNTAKDQTFTFTPAADNAAWINAVPGNTVPNPALTGSIYYDTAGKIMAITAWS